MANCPNVLANGTCSDARCKYSHNIANCEPCGFVFSCHEELEQHLSTKKHLNRISGRFATSYCAICLANITGGQHQWAEHLSGRRHQRNALLTGVDPNILPQTANSTDRDMYCEICQIIMPNKFWPFHIKGLKHKSRESYTKYQSAIQETESNKNDIIVDDNLDFDFVDPSYASTGTTLVTTISTTSPHSRCTLVEVKLASAHGTSRVITAFSAELQGTTRTVTSLKPLQIIVRLQQSHIGRYEDRLELLFEDNQLRKRFLISRTLKAIIGNKAEHEALRPKAPYVPRSRSSRKEIGTVVEGIKPLALKVIPYVVKLPQATIPTHLNTILLGSESTSRLITNVKNIFLPDSFCSSSYSRHFKHLLWIEEFKMERDLERYDISNATLTKHNSYYLLNVPGLAEKRPSVLIGDRILAQDANANNDQWYEGHVHFVRKEEVGLRFHRSFEKSTSANRFQIRFKLSRIPLRRQHQAMDTVFTEDRILFPELGHIMPALPKTAQSLYNTLITTNIPQRQAVGSIVSLPPGSPPFVVFGPPGTGKTITIVEAMLQVLHSNPQARILASAPSNSAADIIASRLKGQLNTDQLFRFYAPSRFKDQVPDELLRYSYVQGDGLFSIPPVARLMKFRVIISTCVSASFAYATGMPRGHFTHIFIDEAGQATEPEAFVSIKTIADSKTNIILSGDPKQLGPIIRSGVARELGLEMSYLERLMDSKAYDLKDSYGKSVVKLVKNFRSHKAILDFPNDEFYRGELEKCADPKGINTYLNSSYLPKKDFPIVFHAVLGKDDREASSPSFFNIDEVLQVKSYVQKLKEDRRFITADSDIGIIAPYHAQCLKLRTALRAVADSVKVGSVEEFQGQERKVIMISTVRSSKDFVDYDLRHTLGFVANPRRFNVAVTRAKAMLIIVGNPQVLSLDPLWRSFLNYIYLNGGWTGPGITWDPHDPVGEAGGYDKAIREAVQLDMNDFTRRLERMTMADVEEDPDANVDRPWREVE